MLNFKNGIICYGIKFEEGYPFPWENDKYGGDHEGWWLHEACKYKPPFDLYGPDGAYLSNIIQPGLMVEAYFVALRKFQEENPFPVEIGNYWSGERPMYILSKCYYTMKNSWGCEEPFLPVPLEARKGERWHLINFCKEYCQLPRKNKVNKFPAMSPQWHLSNCWSS